MAGGDHGASLLQTSRMLQCGKISYGARLARNSD
jgi:hypothetical protein